MQMKCVECSLRVHLEHHRHGIGANPSPACCSQKLVNFFVGYLYLSRSGRGDVVTVAQQSGATVATGRAEQATSSAL